MLVIFHTHIFEKKCLPTKLTELLCLWVVDSAKNTINDRASLHITDSCQCGLWTLDTMVDFHVTEIDAFPGMFRPYLVTLRDFYGKAINRQKIMCLRLVDKVAICQRNVRKY